MNKNLKQLLDNKKYFKLICGAGNQNYSEIEKLVALYSKAGCRFFDLNASIDAIKAAKRGLAYSVPNNELENFHLCVSVGTKDDPHLSKAIINKNLCINCGKCQTVCIQNAIYENNNTREIDSKKCIGCGKCHRLCPHNAISFKNINIDLNLLLPEIINEQISCIELHTITSDINETFSLWEKINNIYDGWLSICIDRSKIGNEQVIELLKKLINNRQPYTTIIQADGSPMSGGKDDFKTTLQALAMGEIIEKADLPVYITVSGGTNSKTALLAKQFDLNICGIAIGSFARKIVKEYIDRDDFLTNEKIFNKALKIATELVENTLINKD